MPDYLAYLIMANEGAVADVGASSQPETTSTDDPLGPDSRN
jgi:hypothetical protein